MAGFLISEPVNPPRTRTSTVKHCPQCDASYEQDLRFCPRDGSALRVAGAGQQLVGQIIADRYHVLQKLGEGGMGQVYLAEHVRMGRKSAIKVMRASMMADPEAIGRFNREAANASRISHPSVAAIYDFGETENGLIYLAMEYVDGEPLSDLLARQRSLSPARAIGIAEQVAAALDAAHDMGIVHRDLKPDNIMLASGRDGRDVVKVVDFGIAKTTDGGGQKVTRTGMVVGTPEYMSPEQLAGDPLDGRSDTYALGLVVFNMLTGTLPFPSETAQESMIARLTERPRTLAEMRPDCSWPVELQRAMDRALARSAADRHPRSGDLAAELTAVLPDMEASGAPAAATVAMTAALPRTVRRGGARGAATALPARSRTGKLLLVAVAAMVVGGGAAAAVLARPWGGHGQQLARDGLVASGTATGAAADGGAPAGMLAHRDVAGEMTAPGGSTAVPVQTTGRETPDAGGSDELEPDRRRSRRDRRGEDPAQSGASTEALVHSSRTDGDRSILPVVDASEVDRELEEAGALLQRAVEEGEGEAVGRAQGQLLQILPRVRSRRDSVRTMYHIAEALIARGQEERACTLLHEIKDDPGQYRRATLVHYDRYCR